MTFADLMLPELARFRKPVLAGLFALDAEKRQAIFRRPTTLTVLWRMEPSDLRTRALREAAR